MKLDDQWSVNGNEETRWRELSPIQFSCGCNYSLITHNKTPVHSTWGLLRVCAVCPTPRLNLSSKLCPSWNDVQDTFLTESVPDALKGPAVQEEFFLDLDSNSIIVPVVLHGKEMELVFFALISTIPMSNTHDLQKLAQGRLCVSHGRKQNHIFACTVKRYVVRN